MILKMGNVMYASTYKLDNVHIIVQLNKRVAEQLETWHVNFGASVSWQIWLCLARMKSFLPVTPYPSCHGVSLLVIIQAFRGKTNTVMSSIYQSPAIPLCSVLGSTVTWQCHPAEPTLPGVQTCLFALPKGWHGVRRRKGCGCSWPDLSPLLLLNASAPKLWWLGNTHFLKGK